jgi:diaminobutyrate-2-oxoglutarate transaminase
MLSHMDVFTRLESNVRSYCRHFPAVFASAQGPWLTTTDGRRYLDLLCGAGSLNYGHNDPVIMERVIDYVRNAGVSNSLDLHTVAKANFLQAFADTILAPRQLCYKAQFTGPTGTNAVEAALKLARKVTGRTGIAAFTGGFHGMTLGSLAATCNPAARAGAGVPLDHVTFLPYQGNLGPTVDSMDYIETLLTRVGSGIGRPAAALIELVQGEGGLSSVTTDWIRRLAHLCKELGILLIVDDIQAGCGRTGSFLSFEPFGIVPDIVVLSKSLSGFGAPFSLLLMRPELDVWQPGEHNGTFRGNNLAFVGATAAIEHYWSDATFSHAIQVRAELVYDRLSQIAGSLPTGAARIKGRGLLIGLEFNDPAIGETTSKRLFERGLIAETCGACQQVLKLLPPLNIELQDLHFALDIIGNEILDAERSKLVSAF